MSHTFYIFAIPMSRVASWRSWSPSGPLAGGDLHESTQLLDGLWVVVYLKAHHYVVVEPHPSTLLHDQHGGRLHSPPVSAGGLTGLQRCQETEGKVACGPVKTARTLSRTSWAGSPCRSRARACGP